MVLENVTSRFKLEETLQQSEKLSSIGLLAAGVAHEVNTPLTGVSSYTQMLLGMIPETDPKHALLQKMQRQTDRASNIVGNLLNFSRTGNIVESAEIDVNKLLDDTLQLLEPQLRKSNVEIVKQYTTTPPRIFGNGGKLQQVFTNLILQVKGDEREDLDINMQPVTAQRLIGAGGIFGRGEAETRALQHFNALPERHNDMVFAPVVTRFGFLGGMALLVLCLAWCAAGAS